MLSVDKCRKFLKGREYTAQEIEEIKNSLYQLATVLIDSFIKQKGEKIDNKASKELKLC